MTLSERYPDWEQAITARSAEVEWSPELLAAVRKVALVMLECDDANVSFEQAVVEIHSMRGDREEVCLSNQGGKPVAQRGGAKWARSVNDVRYLAPVSDLARVTDDEIGEALRTHWQSIDDHMEEHFCMEASVIVDHALSLKGLRPVGAVMDDEEHDQL